MPSERDLRRRVRSIKNIQQLTRAMQLVAASKMRRAQEAVLASRPFEEKLRSVLNDLAPYADPELSPLLVRREVKKIAVVLVTTDRGLVGPMNVNLVRATTRFVADRPSVTYIAIGRKGINSLRRMPVPSNVVNVVAIQRGTSDTGRVIVMTAHFDSRNSSDSDVTGDAPGANDDGSGTAAVLEAARILSRHRFAATIIYATLAGEEQGLYGGQIVARWVQQNGWRMEGNLNNDIVGNTSGGDGVRGDDRTIRVFSDGVPPTEFDSARIRTRRTTGGDVDGVSRQLARYVQMIARRHLPSVDVWLVYRLERFGRGGDHAAFANLGFPAVRLTEAHENYTRQHQNVRVQNDTSYGDVPDSVNFRYLAKVTSLNAASLASLAWAPAPPRMARIGGGGRYAAAMTWQPPEDSADVAKYRVYWRRTDSPTWDNYEDVGLATRYVATGRVVDTYFFGVAAVSRDGHESTIAFPLPGTDR